MEASAGLLFHENLFHWLTNSNAYCTFAVNVISRIMYVCTTLIINFVTS